jgi:O-antigen ligase
MMNGVPSNHCLGVPSGSDPQPMSDTATMNALRRAGQLVLVLILVTTGSYIRSRSTDDALVDWLIIVQIGLAACGGWLGYALVRRCSLGGTCARIVSVYVLAVVVSAFFSSHMVLTLGYWILLAGSSLLCIGLVSSSSREESLRDVERVLLVALSFMLLKDTLIDAIYFLPQVDRMEEMGVEMYRFGMGSTSSNSMGLLAAATLLMYLPIGTKRPLPRALALLWTGFLCGVVLLTRARIAVAVLLAGLSIRWWLVRWVARSVRAPATMVALPCFAASVGLLIGMGSVSRLSPVTELVNFVNRGEDLQTVMSVTGRTHVWAHAVERIVEGPIPVLFGHGYGSSRFVLNENNWNASFFVHHAHNTFLEALLSTGVLGTLPLVALVLYSLRWLARFSELLRSFSPGFALRAASVVTAILGSIFTEAELVTKTSPVLIVFLFYALSLDREKAFFRIGRS